VAFFDIGISATIVYAIRNHEPVRITYNKAYDVYPHWKYAVAPCFAGSLLLNVLVGKEIVFFLPFSIFLEITAILPQFAMMQHMGECDDVTGLYVFFLGAYRPLHVLVSFYLMQEDDHNRRIEERPWGFYVCVFIQAIIYLLFFGCIFKSNASLQQKKDDSILSVKTTDGG
jgi:ER lumen protein retaining receptor